MDVKVDNDKGVFSLMNVDQVMFTAITEGDLDFRLNDFWRMLRVEEGDDSAQTKFAGDVF